MRLLYNALFTIFIPILLLRIYWRGYRNPAQRRRWRERFGFGLPDFSASRPVWIHAVSVGETIAASPIVRHLRERFPAVPILFTTTTLTGAATASMRFGKSIEHFYFPYDLPWVVRRYLNRFDPCLLILMETELWPNLLDSCRTREIPVLLANARLSQTSTRRYGWFPSLTRSMLAAIDCFAVQSDQDATRLIELGALQEAITVTGSIKFDVQLPPSVVEKGQALRRYLGVNRAVLIAASTREGEEELILEAFAKLRIEHPTLLLILAPRHPERSGVCANIFRRRKYHVVRHSSGDSHPTPLDVYLVDSIGELPSFFAASDVAFVGGSLLPFGGHNVLEPAALGVPVAVGSHTQNFSEIVSMLSSVGALRIARGPDELVDILDGWLLSSEARDGAGDCGRRIVAENGGAAIKVAEMVDSILGEVRCG